jgi:hypothetical protein
MEGYEVKVGDFVRRVGGRPIYRVLEILSISKDKVRVRGHELEESGSRWNNDVAECGSINLRAELMGDYELANEYKAVKQFRKELSELLKE